MVDNYSTLLAYIAGGFVGKVKENSLVVLFFLFSLHWCPYLLYEKISVKDNSFAVHKCYFTISTQACAMM